jgi:pimeloyl-ACP methyl ester carboxylesterase
MTVQDDSGLIHDSENFHTETAKLNKSNQMTATLSPFLGGLNGWRSNSLVWEACGLCALAELLFFLLFWYYLIPRANQRTAPQPYRDYGRHRHLVLLRIIDRIYQTCMKTDRCVQDAADKFISEWFLDTASPQSIAALPTIPSLDSVDDQLSEISSYSEPPSPGAPPPVSPSRLIRSKRDAVTEAIKRLYMPPPRPLRAGPEALAYSQSTLPDYTDRPPPWTVEGIGRLDMDEFLAWALFAKQLSELEEWEGQELLESYQQLERRAGIVFSPGQSDRYKPVRMTLEDVKVDQRPLFFYLLFWAFRMGARFILRAVGFRRVVSTKTGLIGWYRPARNGECEKLLPLLFFHGIAPGGLFFYLPMVLFLANDGRSAFLFENPTITFKVTFGAFREEDTVDGVAEILDLFLPRSRGLSLCGHSFGSCPLTWLLHAPAFRERIQQYVLLDPVTLLLSAPDVIMNFLYAKGASKIGLASKELFTQYYLRRHFSWYNSELWLEDIPESTQVLIALSQNDEIIHAPQVKEHVELFGTSSARIIFWEGATHACCIGSPRKWREVKQAMLEQELTIAQRTR